MSGGRAFIVEEDHAGHPDFGEPPHRNGAIAASMRWLIRSSVTLQVSCRSARPDMIHEPGRCDHE